MKQCKKAEGELLNNNDMNEERKTKKTHTHTQTAGRSHSTSFQQYYAISFHSSCCHSLGLVAKIVRCRGSVATVFTPSKPSSSSTFSMSNVKYWSEKGSVLFISNAIGLGRP